MINVMSFGGLTLSDLVRLINGSELTIFEISKDDHDYISISKLIESGALIEVEKDDANLDAGEVGWITVKLNLERLNVEQ